MNKNTKKSVLDTKKSNKLLILLCIIALIFALGTHFTLINNSLMYYIFNEFTTVALFIFPILALALIIFSCVILFKNGKMSFLTPVAIALIGCLLAFVLADGSFTSKIQSDFLKNEIEFNRIVNKFSEDTLSDGIYDIDDSKIKFIAPEKKIIIQSVGNGKYAYCIVTIDIEDRFEGYVYDPYGSPDDWLKYGEYSEPLDIEKKWSYFVYNKGVNYDQN